MRFARAIVPALAFWLSGLACVLVCASTCVRAEAAAHPRACCVRSAQIEAEESCAASASDARMVAEPSVDGCCFRTARPTTQAPVPCGFVLGPAPAARSGVWAAASAPTAPVAVDSFPVRDRGDTHLRCCVFLI